MVLPVVDPALGIDYILVFGRREYEEDRDWLGHSVCERTANDEFLAVVYDESVASGLGTGDHSCAIGFLDALVDVRQSRDQKRPLVFLAQYLGGVVLMEALVYAQMTTEPRYNVLSNYTIIVNFYGIPHIKISDASFQKPVTTLANGVVQLTHQFFRLPREYKVVNRYECIRGDSPIVAELCEDESPSVVCEFKFEDDVSGFARGCSEYYCRMFEEDHDDGSTSVDRQLT
ncbi:MAG: hypothetical protein M1840_005169 [Geoglossum simile]|nr:MAG: hypothetical protein M1840_005169 [Geoglossum simile]